jgi:hypothetical protein
VTPLREAAQRRPLGTSRIESPLDVQRTYRLTRYVRRQTSSGWLIGAAREAAGLPADAPDPSGQWVRPLRPARCRWRVAEAVGLHHSPGRLAHWSGVERCGSIWACPVCSAVIRSERAREISAGVTTWLSADPAHRVVMATVTTRHRRSDALESTLNLALTGWQRMLKRRAWRALVARHGVAGVIRALEVTHGANGWHPHIHALLLTTGPVDVAALQADLFDLWSSIVTSMGGREISRLHGVDVRRAGQGVADYVAKLQEHDRVGHELARIDLKSGRAGSRVPFELLDDPEGRPLWVEYVETTRGRRAITWSHGLKATLGVTDRTDDEVLADTETSDLVGLMTGEQYDQIRNRPADLAGTLSQVEDAGDMALYASTPVDPQDRVNPG